MTVRDANFCTKTLFITGYFWKISNIILYLIILQKVDDTLLSIVILYDDNFYMK